MPPKDDAEATLLAKFTPPVRRTVTALRAMVKRAVPDATEKLQAAWKGFNYDYRGGLIAIAGHSTWATIGFMRGVELDDPEHRLIGTGRTMRSVRVGSAEEVGDPYLLGLVRQAAALNEKLGPPAGVGRAWGGGKAPDVRPPDSRESEFRTRDRRTRR